MITFDTTKTIKLLKTEASELCQPISSQTIPKKQRTNKFVCKNGKKNNLVQAQRNIDYG